MTDAPINSPLNREPMRPAAEQRAGRPAAIDHIGRAKARMAEIRTLQGDAAMDIAEYQDKFYAEAPPGWVYNWKNHSIFNKEYPQYFASLQRNGWEPVPAQRHRELLYPEYNDENIIIEGMILMERPKELHDARVRREHQRAIGQIRTAEQKLAEAPAGTAPRDENQKLRSSMRAGQTVGPADIP